MRRTTRTGVRFGLAFSSALAALATGPVPPAAADIATLYCLVGDRPANPYVGDGPWLGDAPDDEAVKVPLGCYDGRLEDRADRDVFQFVAATMLRFQFQVGCGTAGLEVPAAGFEGRWRLCPDDPVTLLLPPAEQANLRFERGEGVYFFAYE